MTSVALSWQKKPHIAPSLSPVAKTCMSLTQAVFAALCDALLTDLAVRRAAEERVSSLSAQPGFVVSLVEVLLEPQAEAAARQLAAVVLKNFLRTHWCEAAVTFTPPLVSDHEKAAVRAALPRGLSDRVPRIRTAVGVAVATIAQWDWPDEWPSLMDELLRPLEAAAAGGGGAGGGGGAPAAGALRCLELCASELSEDQLPAATQRLLPLLLQLARGAGGDAASAKQAARSVRVARRVIERLSLLVGDDHRQLQRLRAGPVAAWGVLATEQLGQLASRYRVTPPGGTLQKAPSLSLAAPRTKLPRTFFCRRARGPLPLHRAAAAVAAAALLVARLAAARAVLAPAAARRAPVWRAADLPAAAAVRRRQPGRGGGRLRRSLLARASQTPRRLLPACPKRQAPSVCPTPTPTPALPQAPRSGSRRSSRTSSTSSPRWPPPRATTSCCCRRCRSCSTARSPSRSCPSPPSRPWLTASSSACFLLTPSSMASLDGEQAWADDLQQYLLDEEDDTFACSLRVAAQQLLEELVDSCGRRVVTPLCAAVERRLAEARGHTHPRRALSALAAHCAPEGCSGLVLRPRPARRPDATLSDSPHPQDGSSPPLLRLPDARPAPRRRTQRAHSQQAAARTRPPPRQAGGGRARRPSSRWALLRRRCCARVALTLSVAMPRPPRR